MAIDNAAVMPQPVSVEVVQRARDLVMAALTITTMPTIAELTALAELSDECRTRAGATEADALAQLLFQSRRLQTERERRIAQVRKRHQ